MLIQLMFLLAAFKPGVIEGKLSKSNKFLMYSGYVCPCMCSGLQVLNTTLCKCVSRIPFFAFRVENTKTLSQSYLYGLYSY